MNNRNFQSVTNPLYKNRKNTKHIHMSLTDALTSNPKFSSLKHSESPHSKTNNREVDYSTKPVSKFKKSNKLSEMLTKRNIKGISGVPTKKISIKELTNRKKASILSKQKKNVQNKEGLQNMLQNKMKYGEHGFKKNINDKKTVTNTSNKRNVNKTNQKHKINETKTPEDIIKSTIKKETSIKNLNIPSKWKYIISFCMCLFIVMFILIIIFMILYFTAFNNSEDDSNKSNNYRSNQYSISNKNLTNIFSPTTSFPTTSFPTTSSPTTSFPTTSFLTTSSPTTSSPTTSFPTTSFPTTSFPTTSSPTTSSPTTSSPTTLPVILNSIKYNQELTNHVQNITFHVLNVKEIIKVVLNTTQSGFLNLEQKYIKRIEENINEKYNKILSIFNKTYSKTNRYFSSQINTSEQVIKRIILNAHDKQNYIKGETHQIIKLNIRKINKNITKSLNNNFKNILSFLNNTIYSQTLTNDKNYIKKIYFQEEISIKYVLPFYIPFLLYVIYFCCKKYIPKRKKKSILPLHIETTKQERKPKKLKITSPPVKSSNKWKQKIKDLESNINVLMELNKNEKNNKLSQ